MRLPKTFIPEVQLDGNIEKLLNSKPFELNSLAIAVGYIYRDCWATDLMVWTPLLKKPEVVETRLGYTNSLCLHNNLLYDAGDNKQVTDTLNREVIAEREYTIMSLCVHNGVMYDGGLRKIFRTKEKELVAERDGWVKALCSCNGELYDAGSYKKVFRTFDNQVVAERKDWIHALCCHNNTLYDAIEKRIRKTLENKIVARRPDIPFTMFTFNNELYDAGQYYSICKTLPGFLDFRKKELRKIKEKDYGYEYRGVLAVQPISTWLANQLLRKS